MMEAKQGKEVVVRIRNSIGLLFELTKLLSEKGVGILAVNGMVLGEDCVVRVVTNDNLRAKDALVAANYAPHEENVIVIDLPHKPGMLRRVAEILAQEDIDIHHLYATALEEQDKSLLVFHTSNDHHALTKLKDLKTV
ncbi:MAG: ACT domain-containing protein [Thermoguttaceae bacterium]|jgi:hypothetical protein